MTHQYTIEGMTCGSCVAKVKEALSHVSHVLTVEVSMENKMAEIVMEKHIPLSDLQSVLDKKYTISVRERVGDLSTVIPMTGEASFAPSAHPHMEEISASIPWFQTYKPILLIFAFILLISVIGACGASASFNWMHGMNIFMAGFFLTFSFFKLLDLNGFAESYVMYDVLARRIKSWAYIYPFVELALGICYATGFQPLITNIVTLFVMGISIIGVLQSVLNKKVIRCACLGAVFNLPMSTVTIIEDALMIAMSLLMLLVFIF